MNPDGLIERGGAGEAGFSDQLDTNGAVNTPIPSLAAAQSDSAGLSPDLPDSLAGGSYQTGTEIVSDNGRFRAAFLDNGNLVVLDAQAPGQGPIWESGTAGEGDGGVLAVRSDGTLAIFSTHREVVWSSGPLSTGGSLRDHELTLDDQGRLTLRQSENGVTVWSSGAAAAADGWSNLDALEYIASHDDLIQAFGADAQAGRAHFNAQGFEAGRETSFSAGRYAASERDLFEDLDGDLEALAADYIAGQARRLQTTPTGSPSASAPADGWSDLDALEYIASHDDLIQALGADAQAGRAHFNAQGSEAGRATSFSAERYAASERDLFEDLDGDLEALTADFITSQARRLAAPASSEAPSPILAAPGQEAPQAGDILALHNFVGPVHPQDLDILATAQIGPRDINRDPSAQLLAPQIQAPPPASEPAAPPEPVTRLGTGDHSQASLISENGEFRAAITAVGSLEITDLVTGDIVWESGTGLDGGDKSAAQISVGADGNLGLLRNDGSLYWGAGTIQHGQPDQDYTLTLTNTGQLRLTQDATSAEIFATPRYLRPLPGPDLPDTPIADIPTGVTVPEISEGNGLAETVPLTVFDSVDPALLASVLVNGQPLDPAVFAEVSAENFEAALVTIGQLPIPADQREALLSNPAALVGLDHVLSDGGYLQVNSPEELALREIVLQSEDEIYAALARGFDINEGPDADQLAGLNLLAYGHDAAFAELVINWTLSQHPDLALEFNPAERHGERFRFTHESIPEIEHNSFIFWLGSLLPNDGVARQLPLYEGTHDDGYEGLLLGRQNLESGNFEYESEWYSLTPSLEYFREAASDERYRSVVTEAFGVSLIGARPLQDFSLRGLAEPDATILGATTFNLRTSNQTNYLTRRGIDVEPFDGFGSGLFRSVLEREYPELVSGSSDNFLVDHDDAVIDNVTDVGNLNVFDIGSSGTVIDVGAGDANIVSLATEDTQIAGGPGTLNVLAQETVGLRVEDNRADDDSTTSATFVGANEGAFISTDRGTTSITVGTGVLDDARIEGDGELTVEIRPGGVLEDSRIDLGDRDDVFVAEAGSSIIDSEIDGGEGDDRFVFGGEVIGSIVQAGDDNDFIQINETFRGEFDLSDSAAAWIWRGDDDLNEYDSVALQGEGWDLVETGDGQALVARDPETGEILAQINLSGDGEHLESIYTFDENGRIATLQDIPPEVRTRLGFLGPLSQALFALAPLIPALAAPLAALGGGFAFTRNVVNNEVSLGNTLSIISQAVNVLPNADELIQSGVSFVSSAVNEDFAGVALSGFQIGAELEAQNGAANGFFNRAVNGNGPLNLAFDTGRDILGGREPVHRARPERAGSRDQSEPARGLYRRRRDQPGRPAGHCRGGRADRCELHRRQHARDFPRGRRRCERDRCHRERQSGRHPARRCWVYRRDRFGRYRSWPGRADTAWHLVLSQPVRCDTRGRCLRL